MGAEDMVGNDDCAWLDWGLEDVAEWVESLGVPAGEAFRQAGVDGPTLLELTEDELQGCLGVENPIHRKKIMGHTKVLRIKRQRLFQSPVSSPGNARAKHSKNAQRHREVPEKSMRNDKGQHQDAILMRPEDAAHPAGFNNVQTVVKPIMSMSMTGRQVYGDENTPLPREDDLGRAEVPDGMRASSARGTRGVTGGTPTSLPHSARGVVLTRSATERSFGSSIEDPHRSEEGYFFNRHSRYMNPYGKATTGLDSCFGLDSPSYSMRGSFPRAVKPDGYGKRGLPGPATYDTSKPQKLASMQHSPRSVIGSAGRDTAQFLVSTSSSPGVGKYHGTSGAQKSALRKSGGVIGNSPRWSYSNKELKNWTQTTGHYFTPGPSSYDVRYGALSTFR